MKKKDAILMFQVLAPIPATKFTAEIQTALLGNYLKVLKVAEEHDENLKAAADKLRSEGIEDKAVLDEKISEVRNAFREEDAEVEIKKIDRTQFLAEATKAGVEITLAQIGILEPMFG